MLSRQPYKGSTRKLVLALDVGTTFSGVSYCVLDPGEVPVIRGVSRYPAQEKVGDDSKIPSIIYYDLQGNVCAVGAEALQQQIIEQAEEHGWVKLEWWKLHLRAKHLSSSHIQDDDIPPLPRDKSAVQVLADFMRYLFQCARIYIQESHPSLWGSVENSIEFVLTHPNGWEDPQQQQIRRAVELAGLISSAEEQSHVHLVTEGEASLHFCVADVLASDKSSTPIAVSDFHIEKEGQSSSQGVVIVDAGGGTIDLSAYSMQLSPTSFKEIAPAECCLQGSVFVTRRSHTLLKNKLSGSNYSSPEITAQMTSIFDKSTKLKFRKSDEPSYIKFGTIRDKDVKYDIRSGQLKLAGQDVADLFEPSVKAIIEAFERQKRVASTPVNSVFLVGGFAASDWLFAKLQQYLQPLGITFCRPGGHVNKAVADGAVSFYVDRLDTSQVARAITATATCGIEIYTPFDSQNPPVPQTQHPKANTEPTPTIMPSRQPYKGSTRKLLLAFDVGTTFSGVSYCILDPGEAPVIRGVSRYPAQEQVGGDSKIPSIAYYDLQGNVRAVGAEALQEHIIEQAEEHGWVKLEWWKLHLRAKHLSSSHIQDDDIPPLPRGKSAVQVLADFMRYLFKCARIYIQESHPNLWSSVENSIEFVLTHPNGWEGPQQQQIRRAVELAGLISSAEEQSHVHLVTEGEASLHFCVTNVIASDKSSSPIAVSDLPAGEEDRSGSQGVVIVDAGGGTIDISAYSMQLSPTSFEEIAAAECCLQGSVFVTRRAHTLLKNKLSGSNYSSPEMIAQMTSIFDKSTKLRFRKPDEPSYIKFGTIRDKDVKYDIRSGQLKLPGQDVADLFEPSVKAIIEAFERQKRAASIPVNYVFLVGGFAASDWLFARLQEYFQPLGINFCRPDGHVNKAVADGAVSFYIDRLVTSRVARATYGIEVYTPFNRHSADHRARKHTTFTDPGGVLGIPGQFASILLKGTQVSELREFRKPFSTSSRYAWNLNSHSVDIMCYKGVLKEPQWLDIEPSSFSTLCKIHADLSELVKTLSPLQSALDRSDYYRLDFEVIILFGQTELKAQVCWKDKGVEKRGPASIVYDE